MDEFKQANKLDNILRYMAKNGLPRFETSLEIAKGIKAQKSEWTELYLILNKLVKDELIELKEVNTSNPTGIKRVKPITDTLYMIKFEGLFHLESGGYLQRMVDLNADKILIQKQKTQLDTEKAYQREQADRMNFLTMWVAIGSVGIVLIEIVKLIYPLILQLLFHLIF